LRIDVAERSVWLADAALELPPLEHALLYVLAARAGHVVTRAEILDALWGPDETPGSNVVDAAIRRLRVHLGDDWRTPRFIATVSGRGYRLIPPDGGSAARYASTSLAG
jgi:DNA-binding response OmpR family regulator